MWFGKLDISTLENWLWEADCSIRGPIEIAKENPKLQGVIDIVDFNAT